MMAKMYLLQKQIMKESYRFFMTMFAAILFLVMIFYVSSSATGQTNGNIAHYIMAMVLMIYAVGAPLVLFKNLYHPVNVHHVASFPMTRFELFFSQYLLGLVFGLLLVIGYTSLTSLLAGTQSTWIFHTTYLLVMLIYYYHLCVFCVWICGNKLFYAMMVIFSSIGPLLMFLVYQWVMETFAVGYICPSLTQSGIEIFLPILNTFTAIADGVVDGYQLFYLGISVMLLILSMVAVRYRRYEKNGHSITFAALGYFIRFIIAMLCSTFLLALVSSTNSQHETLSIFISYLVICLIVVYCTEMIFTKNTKVFYSLKYGVLLCVFGFFFLNGSSHYIALYIPEQVESVAISLSSKSGLSDIASSNEETIASIQELHQTILDQQEHIYSNDAWAEEMYPLRILYQTGDRSYSERLYYCDEYLYYQIIVPYFENRDIFNMITSAENNLLAEVDNKNWFIRIRIDEQNYDINTDQLRYLFKNYLQQELDAAYADVEQFALEINEAGPYIEVELVNNDDENQYQYLNGGYMPIIEKTIAKTFKE